LEKLQVPCGQCIGCRLERSRQWAVRCIHEAQLHKHNCFITLTYRDADLPSPPTLRVDHFQKFMKRLRKRFGSGIRFFHCGEYGEIYGRPHYHACLFGFDFPDKVLWKEHNGNRLYVSDALHELWPYGYCYIGAVTFESAAYVARYIMKKVNGDASEEHYRRVDPLTGEIFNAKPEYITMSRRPGIAARWFENYRSDVYPDDFVVVRGRPCRPPRFYDNRLKQVDPALFEEVLYERYKNAENYIDNNTPERLQIREAVQEARLKRLVRPLE